MKSIEIDWNFEGHEYKFSIFIQPYKKIHFVKFVQYIKKILGKILALYDRKSQLNATT